MPVGKPNIIIVMADQLSGTFFPDGAPADFLHTPHLKTLAARSARFAKSYTTSPLCLPARASLAAGQLPSRTRVYDNAAEFAASIPTFAHHLRRAGYYTCLSGKMHFVGPDQLHGFEERLTTDIYPADFGWTPDYRKPGERIDWWYHNLGSVTGAGVAETTNQLEYDDEVAFHANQKLHQLARESDAPERRPWCLMVSFTHPHDPYVARRRFWDLYEGCPNLEPKVGRIAFAAQDPHSRRLMLACDYPRFEVTEDDVRRSRRAYFANVSYLDEKLGGLIDTLSRTRMLDDTVIVFCADHGDMLGERGLWFKMNFFEGSARVPLLVAGPGIRAGTHLAPVSILDVSPTLCEIAGISTDDVAAWTDGESLKRVIDGGARTSPVLMEYAAEGSYAPLVAIRKGDWKYVRCALDPEQLFNLANDPEELTNLADGPDHIGELSEFRAMSDARWDLARFDAEVRVSQAQRWLVYEALRSGAYYPWDYQPLQNASERYMRNHMDLDTLEGSKRFPRGG
jgi:choline-sulfatase